jgi:putative ABC transport system substrate-binding protein
MLKEMAPGVRRMALIFNPQTAPYYPIYLRDAEPAVLAAEFVAAPVRDKVELETAIAALG